MIMSEDELLALKELAQKADPFPAEQPGPWKEMDQGEKDRATTSQEFFIEAHRVIPSLVDEYLDLRSRLPILINPAVPKDEIWIAYKGQVIKTKVIP